MSKKMKRVALESSHYAAFVDSKAMLKHQTLLQDFKELHKETVDMRNRLEDAKMRKQRLLAEVHFLRRRHKYLLQTKSSTHLEEQERAAMPSSEFYHKNGTKERIPSKKELKLHKLPPLPGQKQKGKIKVAKQLALQKTPPDFLMNRTHTLGMGKDGVFHGTVSSLNHKSRAYSGKEGAFQKEAPAFDLNQNDRSFVGNSTVSRSMTPFFDLNQDSSHGGNDLLPSRAPVIDLNKISMGEEEPQENFDALMFEGPKRGIIRNLNDDQRNDLQLSVCRNVGEGTSRVGKRKISWQDPVALRV